MVRCALLVVVTLLVCRPLLAQRALGLAVTGNQLAGDGAVRVALTSLGNENRVTFSISYQPAVLRFDSAVLGTSVGSGGTINVNRTQTSAGRVGVDLALPAGAVFSAGDHQVVVLNFSVVATSTTNTTLGFSDSPTDAFVYTVGANTSGTNFAVLTVAAVPTAGAATPTISAEPAGLTVTSGTTATFTVAATGPGALAYQWRRHGFPIAGATGASLTLAAATRADADHYDVVVSNANGSATSAQARLSVAPTSYPGFVAPDPAWVLQPENDSGTISAMLPLADGRCYVSGAFLRAGGLRRTSVLRILADGSVDPAFVPPEIDNTVSELAVQPDGKLVLAGAFSRVGGVVRNRLARLHPDGSVDEAFNFGGSGPSSTPTALLVQPDGKLVLGGPSATYNGVSSPALFRLHPDGRRDTTFGLSLSGVNAVALQADGKLLVGGSFSYTSAGFVYSRLLRLNVDGTVDPTLVIGAELGGTVSALTLQPNGKILVSGAFAVTRLNADGTRDTKFSANPFSSGSVSSLAVAADGKIVAAGPISGTTLSALLARLNPDGSSDPTFVAPPIAAVVNAVAVQSDGRVLVGGSFATVGGVTRYGFARLHADGSLDTAYFLALRGSASIGALAALPGGKFLVARSFDYLRGAAVSSCLVRCLADGTVDPTFNPGGTGTDAIINALVRQPDGKILITGSFTSYNGTPVGRIARLHADGTLDTAFNAGGAGLDQPGAALALLPGGRIVVSGTFTAVNGVARNAPVARLLPDGSVDATFATPAISGGAVETMLVQPDGRILLGGAFTTVNGTGFGRLTRLLSDGALDATFGTSPAPGPNGTVYALALEPAGTILIGGTFTQYVTAARPYLARLGPDGALVADFNPSFATGGGVYSLLVQEDGKVIARGTFTAAGGATTGAAFLARFHANGTHDATFAAGGIASSGISRTGMLMRDDGQLFIPAGTSVGLQVTRPAAAPTVVTAPVNQSATMGGTATFSVAATSQAPATYQWLFNDVSIPGANASTLTLTNLTTAAAGNYRVVVASELGSVTSTAATLTVPTAGGLFISTFAGTAGLSGTVDGVGAAARFTRPYALAVDGAGQCYVADREAHVIRKISPLGVATTLAGLAFSAGSVDGTGSDARFNSPSGVAVDATGHVYVVDTNNHTVRRITPAGVVTTIAGVAGSRGSADGRGAAARFNTPWGLALDSLGTLYVADTSNATIRRIAVDGVVSTPAGLAGAFGATDGIGSVARFYAPVALAVDQAGNVYVADAIGSTVRKLSSGNVVTTYAGTATVPGSADGPALTVARFEQPSGLAVDRSGAVYVADFINQTIRRISVAGVVSTFAGQAGAPGSTDGSAVAARFYQPTGVALDAAENLYIADAQNRTIRRTTANTAAAFVSAPVNAAVPLGGTAQFSVIAGGVPATFTFQWYRSAGGTGAFLPLTDGGVYSGATTARLTVADATLGMSGDGFQVVVNNGIGSPVTSSAAWLVVQLAPAFTSAAHADFSLNNAGSFTFQATGSPAPTFSVVSGVFPPWASLNSTTGVLAGTPTTTLGSPFTFGIQARNGVSPDVAQTFTLTVLEPPLIDSPPNSQAIAVGQPVTFTVVAHGSPAPTYQWRRNSVPLSGATSASFSIAAVTLSDAGNYDVVVSNSAGNATSTASVLTVIAPVPPTITGQPIGAVINVGNVAAFSVSATGTAPLTYQWHRNGDPIAGATGPSLNLGPAQLVHAGAYTVVVTNAIGSVTSAVATLAFTPLAILRQPLATNVAPGSAVTLTVSASGAAFLAYQWRRDGVAIAGATASTYTLPSAQFADAGTYDVLVMNAQGTLTSAPAALTLAGRSLAFTARLAIKPEGAFAFFTVEGPAPKQLLLRAVGPGLTALGVAGAMPDPLLEVFDSAGGLVVKNDNWYDAPRATTIANTAFAVGAIALGSRDKDAAILQTFSPGTHTVRVTSVNADGGVALLELYDTDFAPAASSLPYVAIRGHLAPGNEVLIGGLASAERSLRSFLLRAIGPTLGGPGAFPNPSFNVLRGSSSVGTNDDWDSLPAEAAAVTAATARVSAFPLPPRSADAALVLTGNVHAGPHTVQVGGSPGVGGLVLLELHDLAESRPTRFPPALVSPPRAQTVAMGSPLTLNVLAHATAPLSYQWRHNNVLLAGETAATLTRPTAQLADGGSYTVTATNAHGTATSYPAGISLTPPVGSELATHSVAGGSYLPGSTVTVTQTLTYFDTATAIGWSLDLPPGWTYLSQTGTVADIRPSAGTTGTLDMAWTSPPPSPFTFTCTLAVPAAHTGPKALSGLAVVRSEGFPPRSLPATPNALILIRESPAHTADTDADFRLSLFELTRVIELYNTRIGTTRTGCYAVATTLGSEDGYSADALRAGSTIGALTRYHAADTNRDARLSLTELTRVIELFNTRSGTTRTGAYHAATSPTATEDGFAPGP